MQKQKQTEPKKAEAMPAKAEQAEIKKAEGKPTDAKPANKKPASVKKNDFMQQESFTMKAKPVVAKKPAAKKAEAKKTDAKQASAKKADPKQAEGKKAEEKPIDAKPTDVTGKETIRYKRDKQSNTSGGVWLLVLLLIFLIIATMALLGTVIKNFAFGERNVIALFPGDYLDKNLGYDVTYVNGEELPSFDIGTGGTGDAWGVNAKVDLFRSSYKNDRGEVVVQSSNGDKVIAPGSKNSYDFSLKNNGNISMDYVLSLNNIFNFNGYSLPFQVRLRAGNNWIVGSANEWVTLDQMRGIEVKNTLARDKYITYTLEWQWPMESGEDATLGDLNDTLLGDSVVVAESVDFTLNINTVATVTPGAQPMDASGNPLLKEIFNRLNVVYIGIPLLFFLFMLILSLAILIYRNYVYIQCITGFIPPSSLERYEQRTPGVRARQIELTKVFGVDRQTLPAEVHADRAFFSIMNYQKREKKKGTKGKKLPKPKPTVRYDPLFLSMLNLKDQKETGGMTLRRSTTTDFSALENDPMFFSVLQSPRQKSAIAPNGRFMLSHVYCGEQNLNLAAPGGRTLYFEPWAVRRRWHIHGIKVEKVGKKTVVYIGTDIQAIEIYFVELGGRFVVDSAHYAAIDNKQFVYTEKLKHHPNRQGGNRTPGGLMVDAKGNLFANGIQRVEKSEETEEDAANATERSDAGDQDGKLDFKPADQGGKPDSKSADKDGKPEPKSADKDGKPDSKPADKDRKPEPKSGDQGGKTAAKQEPAGSKPISDGQFIFAAKQPAAKPAGAKPAAKPEEKAK